MFYTQFVYESCHCKSTDLFYFQAIRSFLLDLSQSDLIDHLLPDNKITVLCHIHQVLEIPHTAQELLSGELTPALSMALPAYEDLISKWKGLHVTLPELQHYISIRITKIEEYIGKACKTHIYALAMGLYFFLALQQHILNFFQW